MSEETKPSDFLRDLAKLLRSVPVAYGIDEGDCDQLQSIAYGIELQANPRDEIDPNRALIDASNLLCRYVQEHLPDQYEIHLVMASHEAYIELIDPWGNEICVTPDMDASEIYLACLDAIEHDKETTARELADKKREEQS